MPFGQVHCGGAPAGVRGAPTGVRGHGGNRPCHRCEDRQHLLKSSRPIEGRAESTGAPPWLPSGLLATRLAGHLGGPAPAAVRVRGPHTSLPHLVPSAGQDDAERLLQGPGPAFVPPASTPDRTQPCLCLCQRPRSAHVQRGQERPLRGRELPVSHITTRPWGLTARCGQRGRGVHK